jgi:hypothetical protein
MVARGKLRAESREPRNGRKLAASSWQLAASRGQEAEGIAESGKRGNGDKGTRRKRGLGDGVGSWNF